MTNWAPDEDSDEIIDVDEGQEDVTQSSQPSKGRKKPKSASPNKAKKNLLFNALKTAGGGLKGLAVKAGLWLAGLGLPALLGCLGLLALLAIILIPLTCGSCHGIWGTTSRVPAGKGNPDVQALVKANKQNAGAAAGLFSSGGNNPQNHKLDFLNKRDLEYLESGEIDYRTAAALNSVVQKHDHIRVSHIVSGYEDMKTNPESGGFHDEKILKNISAHKNGLAFDIDEIDFVKDKCKCGSDIPVKVSWQVKGENQSQAPSDVLSKIKGPADFENIDIQKALEKAGVKNLGQKDIAQKMKSVPALAGVTSVFDLTKEDVIAGFKTIGVEGVDNPDFQSGLKKLKAMQNLSEITGENADILSSPAVQSALSVAGIGFSKETIDKIKKLQQGQAFGNVQSVDEINSNPALKSALSILGQSSDDPNFQKALDKIASAGTVVNWDFSRDDPKYLDALKKFDFTKNADFDIAISMLTAGKNTFGAPTTQLTSDAETVGALEMLSIFVDSPEAQKALDAFKTAYQMDKYEGDFNDSQFFDIVAGLSLPGENSDQQTAISKFLAAKKVSDPETFANDALYKAAAAKLGIPTDDQAKDLLEKYQASIILSSSNKGVFDENSKNVQDSLAKLGAKSMEDKIAQAAIKAAQSIDVSDQTAEALWNAAGIYDDGRQTLKKLTAAKNIVNINDFDDLGSTNAKKDLATLGLSDVKYAQYMKKLGAAETLLTIKSPDDLNSKQVKKALGTLDINNPAVYSTIGKIGALQTVYSMKDPAGLNTKIGKQALQTLNIKSAAAKANVGKLIGIHSLLDIKSPTDLLKTDVINSLNSLGITEGSLQVSLPNAGSFYSLTQIKEPQDLLKPENLKAMGQLGIINYNEELLGQVGAIQTLMQVRSLNDLMNPNSILALNSLGIISLSNPVTAALTAAVMISQICGDTCNFLGGLVGGIFGFGGCKGNTNCYKPTAQKNIHNTIGQLLQFPYDRQDTTTYAVVQLITYSYERDVAPFKTQTDDLYGSLHPANYGLFAMPEAWGNIHVGY